MRVIWKNVFYKALSLALYISSAQQILTLAIDIKFNTLAFQQNLLINNPFLNLIKIL